MCMGVRMRRGGGQGGGGGRESFFCKLWDFLCFCVDSLTSTLDLVVFFHFIGRLVPAYFILFT